MKAVLISIQPKWCELIASEKKTVEVRKTKPNNAIPFKVYIYCTKDEPLYRSGEKFWCKTSGEFGNGKVIGEFVCNRIDEVYQCNSGWVEENACVSRHEFFDYLGIPQGTHLGYDKKAYAWHISNLVIYDKPKELSEFITPTACESEVAKKMMCNTCCLSAEFCSKKPQKITRPPQSWCYVEELKGEI